jgi:hypothetical protein
MYLVIPLIAASNSAQLLCAIPNPGHSLLKKLKQVLLFEEKIPGLTARITSILHFQYWQQSHVLKQLIPPQILTSPPQAQAKLEPLGPPTLQIVPQNVFLRV